MSNLGLTITITLIPMNQTTDREPAWPPYYNAVLDCRSADDPDQRLALRGTCGFGDDINRFYLCRREDKSRISTLSQRQLDIEKRTTIRKSVILLRQPGDSEEQRMFAEPVTVSLDVTLDGQTTAHHIISIKNYYPSNPSLRVL